MNKCIDAYKYQNKVEPTMACDITITYVTNSRITWFSWYNYLNDYNYKLLEMYSVFIKRETLFAPLVLEKK